MIGLLSGNQNIIRVHSLKCEKAKVLRSWGRMSTLIKDSENINKRLDIKLDGFDYYKKFVFSEVGYNFEPSEIGASFGLIQLKKFKSFNKLRNKNFNSHLRFFKNYEKFFIIPRIMNNIKTNFLAFPVIIKENKYFKRKNYKYFWKKIIFKRDLYLVETF